MADHRRVVFLSFVNFFFLFQCCLAELNGLNAPQEQPAQQGYKNVAGESNRIDNFNANPRGYEANPGAARAANAGMGRVNPVDGQGGQPVQYHAQDAPVGNQVGDGQHQAGNPVNPLNAAGVNPVVSGLRKMQEKLGSVVGGHKGFVRPGAGNALRLADHPDCQADVESLCAKTVRNNFQILDCLQGDKASEKTVSTKCQHLIYSYKRNLTQDMRFDSAASQVCKDDLTRLTECDELEKGTGKRISCLIEKKENITKPGCRQFLTKMASIIFSDYRLICNFQEKCAADIQTLQCGRLADSDTNAPHSQGRVIECLSSKVKSLSEDCKHEILRIAELQSDDFHEDRTLYYACRDDRERFCGNVASGNGKVYKCLFKHKFDRSMSTDCRKQLTRRQTLMTEDVKVNRGLIQQCKAAVKKYKCFEEDGISKLKEARQATILTCLEGAIRDGSRVEPECVAELKETRRSLMQDYKISPDLVVACDDEIRSSCGGGVEREGKTLHCLMDLARKRPSDGQKVISTECKKELEDVIDRADPGESLALDPALQAACGAVAQAICKGKKDEEGNVISCLMEKIGSNDMTDDCEEKLLEIQYFVARDFRLDPRLYKYCKSDAISLCSAQDQWSRQDGDTTPERGAHTFACLYRQYKSGATDQQLSRACAFEVRRVMRQRAVSVELNPRIMEPCMTDLSYLCGDQVKKGEELSCLQRKFKELEPDCQKAIGNFTQDQDKDVRMDKIIMRRCTPMIKQFCSDVFKSRVWMKRRQDLLDDKSTEPGEVMACLIKHKTDGEMDEKCRAGIEHHQLISLEDYRFSYKFKEACKQDVLTNCKNGVKTKAEVVKCLSEMIRNDTIRDHDHRVSAQCRSQLTLQLLQRSENVNLDPTLKESCQYDMETYCSDVQAGSGNILQCLKKYQDSLSGPCKKLIFKRQEIESVNVKGDFFLFKQCKRMIKTYCAEAQPGQVFKCLREHKAEHDFDKLCKKALIERMREKAKDVRLNVNLMSACKLDIDKFCAAEMDDIKSTGSQLEGKVMECLRIRFAQKRLSESCSTLMSGKVKESALDYKQDPILAQSCQNEIHTFCQDKIVAKDLDDQGQVEECLKVQMVRGKITNTKCLKALARSLAESKADVHVDPILYRACAMDIKHYCQGVPRGEGRQMSCLLAGLDDQKSHLTTDCAHMLRGRRQMWENAAEQAPPETLNEVLNLMAISPSRNYLLSIVFIVIGCIFFFGLCCGRVSKRIRREVKNR